MLQSHYFGTSTSCEEKAATMQAMLSEKPWERNAYSLLLEDFQVPGGSAG